MPWPPYSLGDAVAGKLSVSVRQLVTSRGSELLGCSERGLSVADELWMHDYTELAAATYCPPDGTQLSGVGEEHNRSQSSQGPSTHLAGGATPWAVCSQNRAQRRTHRKCGAKAWQQKDSLHFRWLIRQVCSWGNVAVDRGSLLSLQPFCIFLNRKTKTTKDRPPPNLHNFPLDCHVDWLNLWFLRLENGLKALEVTRWGEF